MVIEMDGNVAQPVIVNTMPQIALPQNIVLSIRGLDVLLNMSSEAEREQIQQKLQNFIDASIREKLLGMAALVQQVQDTAGRETNQNEEGDVVR